MKLDDEWSYCEMCPYKCKKQKTLEKHTNNQHANFKICNICDQKVGTEEILTKHMIKEHKESLADNQDIICTKCTMKNLCICEWIDKAMELENQ